MDLKLIEGFISKYANYAIWKGKYWKYYYF
jgi:hypothetical protein